MNNDIQAPPFCGVCGADLSGVAWTVDKPTGHYDGPVGAWKSCPTCGDDCDIHDLSWDREEIDGGPVWARVDEAETRLTEARRGAGLLMDVVFNQGRPGAFRALGPILACLEGFEIVPREERDELARLLRSLGVTL